MWARFALYFLFTHCASSGAEDDPGDVGVLVFHESPTRVPQGGEGRVFGSRVPYKRGDKRPVFEFPGSRTCWSISGHLEDFLFYF